MNDDLPLSDEEKLGIMIRKKREKHALSQDELAQDAGISVRTLIDIESGKVNSKHLTIRNIANAMNEHIVVLFDYDEEYEKKEDNKNENEKL